MHGVFTDSARITSHCNTTSSQLKERGRGGGEHNNLQTYDFSEAGRWPGQPCSRLLDASAATMPMRPGSGHHRRRDPRRCPADHPVQSTILTAHASRKSEPAPKEVLAWGSSKPGAYAIAYGEVTRTQSSEMEPYTGRVGWNPIRAIDEWIPEREKYDP